MAWTVNWSVVVDGTDVTSRLRPLLIDIEVQDKDGTVSDTCSLTLDDTGGQIKMPRIGGKVAVSLQGTKVFEGTIDATPWSMSRGAGRTMKISAKGFDSRGKVKEPQAFHKDDTTLKSFLGAAAEKAGLTLDVDPAFASITRDYWSAENESVVHLGTRLARELYGTFKIRGSKAVLAKRGGGTAAGGAMPVVVGRCGDGGNVIEVSGLSPKDPRRVFSKAQVKWFDRKAAKFQVEEVGFGGEGGEDVANLVRSTKHDKAQSQETAEGRKRQSEREAGGGSVTLDLAVDAQAEGMLMLTGARPGIDGAWRIVSVTHKASRSGGSTTSLELKQPGERAGDDDR